MKNRKRKISWKMLFSTIWLAKENRRDRNRGESFPSRTHFFNPPKSRGKCGEKSAMKALLHKYPLTCPSFMTWWLLPLLIFITFASSHSYLHSTPMSRFSSLYLFFFFLFFKCDLIKLIHSIVSCPHYIPHQSIVSCWFFGFVWHSFFFSFIYLPCPH